MKEIEVNGERYSPEDLDCNGNPYSDARPANQSSVLSTPNSHWPFTPAPGDIITISSYNNPATFAEEVLSVDTARFEIQPSRFLGTSSYWCFCLTCWTNGSTFEKYDPNSGVRVLKS